MCRHNVFCVLYHSLLKQKVTLLSVSLSTGKDPFLTDHSALRLHWDELTLEHVVRLCDSKLYSVFTSRPPGAQK